MPGNQLQLPTMGNGYTLKAVWQPTSGGPTLSPAVSQPFNVGPQHQLNGLKIGSIVPSQYAVGMTLPPIEVDIYGVDNKILINDSTDRITLKTGGDLWHADPDCCEWQGHLQ